MRRAARIDDSHGEIVRVLRLLGWSILPLFREGAGVPDLLVARGDRWSFIECKSARGRLNPAQVEFRQAWGADRVVVLRSADDAIAWSCGRAA